MKKLISGQEYTLSDLFKDNNKIIIPDLQRDYCWGDEKHGKDQTKIELVSGFIDSLFENFKENDTNLNLGMLYGYENPINHINLADGQQRITTLFLLIGMLYKKIKTKDLKNVLISKFELEEDDKEPYLQYAIRESTLYFLSDLVVNFFLSDPLKDVKEIKIKADWYFSEYDQDPSIQSMLEALKIIDGKLLKKENDELVNFADFLINKITFLYFDMESRERGEDLFVIINTTGEPLTATENLKPILLGEKNENEKYLGNTENEETKKKFNDEWEDREKFFWQNRKDDEFEADEGVKDFLTWFVRIQKKVDEVNLYKYFLDSENKKEELENIEKYFLELKILLDYFKKKNFIKVLNQIFNHSNEKYDYSIKELRDWSSTGRNIIRQQNILLPLLCFMENVSEKEEDVYPFLRRLRKNYFDEKRKGRNGNYVDWRYILKIIEISKVTDDVFKFSLEESEIEKKFDKIPNVKNNVTQWYNEEEKIKDKLKENYKNEIEEWEDFNTFQGDISPLFKAYKQINSSCEVDFETCKKLFNIYKMLINEAPNNKNLKLSNHYNLLRILCDYEKYRNFWVNYEKYQAIEKKDNRFLHNKNWFYPIWLGLYKHNKICEWGNILETFNKKFFAVAIKNQFLSDELIFEGFQNKITISRDKYNDFILIRTKNWNFGGGCILSTIFVLIFLEILYNKDQKISFSQEQIGIRPFFENDEVDNQFKFTLGNTNWGFHSYGSTNLENNFSLFGKICAIHKKNDLKLVKEIEDDILVKSGLFD